MIVYEITMNFIRFIQTGFFRLGTGDSFDSKSISMRANHQSDRQPCRYGRGCKFLNTKNCNFYHPPQDFAALGRQDYINKPNQQRPQQRSISRGKNHHYNNQQHSYYQEQVMPNIHGHNPKGAKHKEDPTRTLCKSFHLGIACKQGDKCDRLHQFLYKSPEGLRRLQFRRDIPQHLSSKLTKLECGGKEVFALQQGSQVMFFEYSFENNQLSSLGTPIGLPDKFTYYDQKGNSLYFASENEFTKYYDMGFYNFQTQESSLITNAHTSKLTGILHWDQHTLFSSSLIGDIKAWTRTEEGFVFNKEVSEKLVNQYNPQRTPLEILFLQICTYNDVKIILAGTSDARILFWSGPTFDFMEFHLQKRYAKVYRTRLIQVEGMLTAAVLTWNSESTYSAVLLLNLQSGAVSVVRQVDSSEKFKKNLHLLECCEQYLFVGSLRGEVSVYNLRVSEKKVGAILHEGLVGDLICSRVEMRSTGVRVRLVYILQRRSQEIQGSFGIYLLNDGP